ncbi:MAG: hypothetical protein R6W94_06615 [Spirochaetia bacterium]
MILAVHDLSVVRRRPVFDRILYSTDLVEAFEETSEDETDDGEDSTGGEDDEGTTEDDGGFFSCARRSEESDAPSSASMLPIIGFLGLIAARFGFKKRH